MSELQFPRRFITGGGPAHWAQWAATQVADGLPIMPVTWFGPRDRDPKTASVDRCALAVARPSLAPRLDARARALLDWAIRAATTARTRLWADDWSCTYDSARFGKPITADDWAAPISGSQRRAVTYEHRGFRWSGVMRDMTYWAGKINPPLDPSTIFRGVMA